MFYYVMRDAHLTDRRKLRVLPSSARSAGHRNQPSHSTVLACPVCLFVCVGAASLPCARPLLPSQTGPTDSVTSPVIVLYSRALCARLCVLAPPPSPAGFLMSAHLSRLRLFQRHLRILVWGLGLGSLSHSSSHALSFFSPPSFHTLSLSLAFTSVWWSA